MKITIIGDGGWGTALSVLLSKKGISVTLWGAFADYINILKQKRENLKFLPGITIPESVKFTDSLEIALKGAEIVVLAVPAQYMRGVLRKIKKYNCALIKFLTVAKGIELETAKFMSEVICLELGKVKLAVLSGPNIASEVAQGIPSACVCASLDKDLSLEIQEIFTSNLFRVYTHNDLIGVELGGALKNVIAIACGICDGLGFGANTKAALLTRGLAEITRLGRALGADYKTFSGLSGMGDLVATCFSDKSRNRYLGEQIGKGKKLSEILSGTEMVIEGVVTTKSALKVATEHNLSLPITKEVFNVLFENKKPGLAVMDLMSRAKKEETDSPD
ncbi:MAG: glycerol-3-phosphate dehydrogenase [Candidatus Omnitrophota bacterium]|nr:MAG: glycerol-3-phosphate dehydrogenase [Candidatus Omnitrophota bacterium]